jgi:CoA-transferase family III
MIPVSGHILTQTRPIILPRVPQRSWLSPFAPTISSAPKESSHLPPESTYFLSVNRNKRSITVNFKTPEGLQIIQKLIERSDIFVEKFVSGTRAACKLGWACFGRYGMNKPTINASTSLLLLLRYSQSSTPPPRSKFSDNKKEA